jgi:hypothetical protein
MRLLVAEFNSDMHRMLRSVAEARRMTIMPVLQAQQVMERAAGARLQEMVTSWVKAQQTTIAPLLQVQQVMERAAGARLQEMVSSMIEAQHTTIAPLLQVQQAIEAAARGPLQEMVTSWVKAQETTIAPLLQVQEAIEAAAGARLQEMVRTLVMQRWEIRPLLDAQRMAEIAQGVLESGTTGSGESTIDGGFANAAVALPGNAPLFPGLANPWQQVRNWELKVWVGFFLTVATILLAVAQLRGSGGITPQEVEQIIRSVQESAWTSSTTSAPTTAPSTTTRSTTSAPTTARPSSRKASGRSVRPVDGEHGGAPRHADRARRVRGEAGPR